MESMNRRFAPLSILAYNEQMTATAHILVAGAIVSKIPNPYISLPLVFASHFVMDAVPHWDFGTNWRRRPKRMTAVLAIAETLVGLGVGYLVWSTQVAPTTLAAASVLSILPDWLESPWYIFFANAQKHGPAKQAGFWEKLTFRIYKTENIFHTKAQFPLGLITQVATVAFFLLLLR